MRVVTALWLRHLKHFWRNKIQLVFMFAMPFFFLYVFSSIFAVEGIDNPVNYMLSGIVITGVFQTSLTVASSTITDIVSGFMKEVLVSPVKRIQVAAGQILAAATVSALEAVLVLVVGFFIGLRFTSFLTPLLALLVIVVSGIVFGGFGLFIATLVKNAQTYQIIEMAITMPLVFICGAYVPLSMLPRALQVVAHFNPLTYTTAFFRTVILEKWNLPVDQLIAEQLAFPVGSFVITPFVSMLITLAFGLLFLTLATLVFTKVDFSRIHRTKLADSDILAGAPLTHVGIMLSGKANIEQDDYWGNRSILAQVGPGELFGEAFSCAGVQKLPVNVYAAEQSEILLVDYLKIVAGHCPACVFHAQLIQNMLRILAQKNVALTQKIETITQRTTRSKLLAYLSAQAKKQGANEFEIPFSRQELADYLSVDRSAMSSELSKMQREGILEFHKNSFLLL